MLIGVCGKAGAGKDTIGSYLVTNYGFKQIALADPIKRLVKDVFVLDDHTVYDRVAREKPLEQWNGWTVRKLLQTIGTEMFRKTIDESIWVKSLWQRVAKDIQSDYVVTDVRFPNELEFLKDSAGEKFVSIKVTRNGCNGNVGVNGHESEKYDLSTDFILSNNGTIQELCMQVDLLIQKIRCKDNDE